MQIRICYRMSVNAFEIIPGLITVGCIPAAQQLSKGQSSGKQMSGS